MTELFHRIKESAAFLCQFRPLWEQRPFVNLPVPWEKDWPQLSTLLRRIPVNQIEAIEADPVAFLSVSGQEVALASKLRHFSSVPTLCPRTLNMPRRPQQINDRKWQQIVHFIETIAFTIPSTVTQWVDWCAGKGNLGIAVGQRFQQPVHCLEIRQPMVTKGNLISSGKNVTFHQADVMKNNVSHFFLENAGIVALHACGNLNSRLFELAVAFKPAFLAVVPCCYQHIDGLHFHPLSQAGRDTGLHFTRHQLRLPALDEVKSSPEKRRFRKREMAFRQGVDLLLRQASESQDYTPLGRMPPDVIRGSFKEFAEFAAKKVNRQLPMSINWEQAESDGWKRQHLVSAVSISRQLFRRAIELWLFFDRVAYLEENGFDVTFGSFCPRDITPRNLMLIATPSSRHS